MASKLDNVKRYTAGAVIGSLVALGGVGLKGGSLFPEQKPQVQVKVKVVEKRVEVPVIKKVYVPKPVEKVRVYRVSVLDDNGNVVQTYRDITKFQFRIIGAVLTDKSGKTFDVDGNISVEPVK